MKRAAQSNKVSSPLSLGRRAGYPFLQLKSKFPIKPLIDSVTGEQFTVVCLRQEDGRYVAEILNHPEFRYVGRTRQQAELVVSRMYQARQRPPRKTLHPGEEDRLWLELARANSETAGVTIDEFRTRRGL
jgi:hypothetical protein